MKNTKPRHRRTHKKPSPPEVSVLRVDDLSRAGAGVAKDAAGRIIFIPYTTPGDVVKVKILSQKSHYAQAQLLEIVEPSPQRQTPPCPVFGRCGGCDWQHVPYSLQWETKVNGVQEALRRFKVPVPSLLQLYPARQIWSYRNRIQLRGFREEIGYYAKSSHTLVAIDSCAIARPELNAHIDVIRRQGQTQPRPYKVEMEVLPDGEMRSHWNTETAVAGFQQVNTEQNQKLKQWVFDNIRRDRPILDLYGGSANLSAQLAPFSPQIDCVDLSIPQDWANTFPANLAFHKSDVFPWVVHQARQAGARKSPSDMEPRSAIIDPPRGGMPEQLEEFIQCLQQLNVCELIAVGCRTDTWARDLAGFVQHGWSVDNIAILDFFPQTAHVETAALLTKKVKKGTK